MVEIILWLSELTSIYISVRDPLHHGGLVSVCFLDIVDCLGGEETAADSVGLPESTV